MLQDETFAKSSQPIVCMRRGNKLVWVCTPIVTDGNRFPAPNQFATALTETFPPPHRALSWISIRGAIPAFHRLDGDSISNLERADYERCLQWRFTSRNKLVIARKIQGQTLQMLFEARDILHTA